jgi:flagellar motor switch protein FliM
MAEAEPKSNATASSFRPTNLCAEPAMQRGNLPGLELILDFTARAARTELAALLKKQPIVNFAELKTTKFEALKKELGKSDCLLLFKSDKLAGNGLIVLPDNFASYVVDVLLGGTGKPFKLKKPRSEYSECDYRLCASFAKSFLSCLHKGFGRIGDFSFIYSNYETDPRFLNIADDKDTIYQASFNYQTSSQEFIFSIIFPKPFVEPLLAKLAHPSASIEQAVNSHSKKLIESQLRKTTALVSVELGNAKIKIDEVLSLQVGDIINLNQATDEPVTVKIEREPKFKAELGIKAGSKCIKIKSLIVT